LKSIGTRHEPRRSRPGQRARQSVDGRAERDTDTSVGVCTDRKAPMQRRRHTGQPEQALGPDPIRCASAHRTAPAPRCGTLQRACSLDGTAPRTDQPGNRLGSLRNGGAKQGQPSGAKSGAGGTASVVARINPLQSDPGRFSSRSRPTAGTAGLASVPRDDLNTQQCAPGRQRQVGAGERHRQRQRATRPPVWQTARCSLACTPGTRRRLWTLWTKHGSRSLASLAVHGGGIGQTLRGRPRSRLRQAPRYQRMLLRQDSPAWVGVTNHLWTLVLRHALTEVGDDNGKKARTAVMRHGYRRGECFEGYEPRCGERCRAARPVGAGTFGFLKQTARGRHRETQRTLSGSGCNTPEPPERSKPSRW
jgi:hypothetical protein